MKQGIARTPSDGSRARERNRGGEARRRTTRTEDSPGSTRRTRRSRSSEPEPGAAANDDVSDITDDELFERALSSYQDEYEGLDLLDDDPSSWSGDEFAPLVQLSRFPDDGEKRHALHRLRKLRTR